MENVSDKYSRENETHLMFNKLEKKSLALFQIMKKKIVELTGHR